MNVVIKKSKIKGAKKGLFVNGTHTFKVTDIICPYEGVFVEYDIAVSDEYKSDYILTAKEDEWCIDAQHTNTLGKYANDCIIAAQYNARLVSNDNLTAFLVAKKTIKPNSEIYVWYGEEYWHDHTHFKMLSLELRQILYDESSDEFREWIEEHYAESITI